jgi:predicted nucleotidyltransferase
MEVDEEIIDRIREQLEGINCQPFFLCISGSDNYGFASQNNSDVDIRGAYFYMDPDDMFSPGLERKLTREGEHFFEGMKYEWQIHEISKFLRLMGKSNMNIFDWVYSNDWILLPPHFMEWPLERFRETAPKFLSQSLIEHAFGWCKHMYNQDWRDPKKILHSIRPLMTCLNYIHTGNYQPNIQLLIQEPELASYSGLVYALIGLKIKGSPVSDQVKMLSLQCYDELKMRIEGLRDRVPKRTDSDLQVKRMITDIRLRTLEKFGNME